MNGSVYVYKIIKTMIKGCDVPHKQKQKQKQKCCSKALSGPTIDCVVSHLGLATGIVSIH